MPERIKRLDQQRHELKALRYLLDRHPAGLQDPVAQPGRADFQIEDSRLMFDALVSAATQTEAARAIESLTLEETDVDSFLRLGGQFYHDYPRLVKERGQAFRDGTVELADPAGD